ncbi:hypothetical protein [Lysobacter panacisoli]|uniref:Uncharacterized protein n=1 Tax=Lysobacter panacisoli TaxID=1255263 RepID=A0ABP9LB16_9GAMM|nr:hypothetical protein [Lysobacter panacisoli]
MPAAKSKTRAHETTLRHVWLASLGLLAIGQREAFAARGRLVARAVDLEGRARAFAGSAGAQLRGQVEPTVVRFSADIEARLAPVLDKLGLASQRKRPVRKASKAAKRARPAQGRATSARRARKG